MEGELELEGEIEMETVEIREMERVDFRSVFARSAKVGGFGKERDRVAV